MGKIENIIADLNLTEEQLKDKEIQKFALQVAYRKQSGEYYQYWNGNGFCEINKNNGTLITTVLNDEPFKAEFPNNIDLNISNRCKIGCKFCYQNCTLNGKDADIKKFIEDKNSFLYSLHEGTELAINGNEPFHPDLELLLDFCMTRKIIANLTVNELTLILHKEYIETLLKTGKINGLGVSPKVFEPSIIEFLSKTPKSVIHTIAGITTPEQYKLMYDKGIKVLILGYKDFGRGIDYKLNDNNEIESNMKWLKENIKDFVNHFKVVSFDNLAIEQLNPKEWLTEEQWNRFYRGDDGSYTLFIDLVNETYAKNSIQNKENHKPLLNDVRDMLKDIQSTH